MTGPIISQSQTRAREGGRGPSLTESYLCCAPGAVCQSGAIKQPRKDAERRRSGVDGQATLATRPGCPGTPLATDYTGHKMLHLLFAALCRETACL
eukprot:COSAG01_NODE_2067_length_8506_cov_221.825384_6_plen_96_part_00